MRFVFVGLLLCSGIVACGCSATGPSAASGSMPAASHGGNMLQIPGGKGFAELSIERGPAGKGSSTTPSRLVAYFYQADGTSALSPPPSDVTIHLGAEGGKDVKDVKLTAETKPAGQFASEPGQYPDELRGRLAVVLAGESVEIPFMFR